MMVLRFFCFLCVLFLALGAGTGAHAALLFCNHTPVILEAALGYRQQEQWMSEGWWQLQPGQCARVLNKSLEQHYYFYYARALSAAPKMANAPQLWEGPYPFCTNGKAFKIQGDNDCKRRGFEKKGFAGFEIDGKQKSYTVTFEMPKA